MSQNRTTDLTIPLGVMTFVMAVLVVFLVGLCIDRTLFRYKLDSIKAIDTEAILSNRQDN